MLYRVFLKKYPKKSYFKGDKDITMIILALFKRGVRFSVLALEFFSSSRINALRSREDLCLLNSGAIYKCEAFAFSCHYDQ